jgi:hypothetical protein
MPTMRSVTNLTSLGRAGGGGPYAVEAKEGGFPSHVATTLQHSPGAPDRQQQAP